MAKRVSIINFKGGVGKTTLAFHLATGLAEFHNARVLLIDMDHQSSLSIICLGTDGWEAVVESGSTANLIFSGFNSGNLPGRDIISATTLRSKYRDVHIVPASLDLDNTEIELTASASGRVDSDWKKRTLMCHWIEDTGVDDEYDYLLFDCAPATKIISQNAIAASHGYIIPVVPEAVMERGAPHLQSMIQSGIDATLSKLSKLDDKPSAVFVCKTKLVGLVVTRIQVAGNAESGYTNDHTQHLESLQAQWSDQLLKPYIKQGTGVSSALTDRVPVYDRSGTQNVGNRRIHKQYRELVDELKRRIDDL